MGLPGCSIGDQNVKMHGNTSVVVSKVYEFLGDGDGSSQPAATTVNLLSETG